MDAHRFDDLVRALTRSRRAVFSSALGLGALAVPAWLDARKKKHKSRKRRKRRKRKNRKRNKTATKEVIFNDFGCVDVGAFCTSNEQCCSGICTGPGKKACQAHDQSTCLAGQVEAGCLGESVACTTSTGIAGDCDTTTGNAGYCTAALALLCYPCSTDADCVPVCGPQAACIKCAVCENDRNTSCAGLHVGGCEFPAES